MRDPKRIDKFCNELAAIWKSNAPDWRFGQLMSNFQRWCAVKKIDIFFPEENEILKLFKEFLGVSDKTEESISNLHLVFEPSGGFDENEYEIWNEDVWYIANIYLHRKLHSIAGTDRCGVIGKTNRDVIRNLKNKAIIKVEVLIDGKAYPSTLYIWKRNVVKGLIVADNDVDEIKNYAKSMWETESYIL